MDKTSNDTLIALFEMLNERLYNIEQGNNTMIKYLKNKCIKERVLDKDLFNLPGEVRTFYHVWNELEKGTLVYMSPVILDEENIDFFSIYQKHNFIKVKPFLASILTSEQIEKVEQHVDVAKDGEIIRCKHLGVESTFIDIDHYIINEFVKHHCKNVQRVIYNFGFYDFILCGVSTFEQAIECVSKVFDLFDYPLKPLVYDNGYINVILCPTKYWANFEIVCNSIIGSYDWKTFPQELGLSLDDISQYLGLLEKMHKDNKYENAPNIDDASSVSCCLDTLYELFDMMSPSDDEDDDNEQ